MTSETCWILGRGGLLGSGLRKALGRRSVTEFVPEQRFPWNDTDACQRTIRDAARTFRTMSAGTSWRVIWAAGSGTMGSAAEELARETSMVETLLSELGTWTDIGNGTVVYASSAGAVYAGCRDDVITEHSDPVPVNPYGEAKLREENMIREFHMRHPACTVLVARITNLYGSGQSASKRQGLISHIARSILRRQSVNIFVPFDTIRDYITADSAAEMILRNTDLLQSGTFMTKIIASEEPTTIAAIIGAFKTVTRIPPRVITSASPLSASYPHRMCFRSVVGTPKEKEPPLLVGVSDVLRAERGALQNG